MCQEPCRIFQDPNWVLGQEVGLGGAVVWGMLGVRSVGLSASSAPSQLPALKKRLASRLCDLQANSMFFRVCIQECSGGHDILELLQ